MAKEYGPIYTFWVGSKPFIIISDLKTANEAFIVKRNAIAGRPYISYRKYKTVEICPNSMKGVSTCFAPICINIKKLATKI